MANTLLSTVNAAKQRQPMCTECEKSLPNQIVFDKIESIIRLMQDEQNGLPVKTAKSFMSKIPSVFTGTDLIQWMMRNLKLEDQQEAVHLANLIASHGYIFPIEDHTLSIKNDCTFYRFQTPCLWPSNNSDPENTDYAVYLCKRTMQGKTRLELADYEAENLARLQKMFSRKWEFIFMQAESQAKVDKKRDKLERKVLDSQERAFWDVYRPVIFGPPWHRLSRIQPGCVNTTEMDIKKACRLSKTAKRCAECQKVGTPVTSSALPSAAPSPDVAQEGGGGERPGVVSSPTPSPNDRTSERMPRNADESSAAIATAATVEPTQPVRRKDETRKTAPVRQLSERQEGGGRPARGAHQHHHHHHQHQHSHHHHHHHPHQHSHHHHHRQCPHHKHHVAPQQPATAPSSEPAQLSIPTESILTTTLAASAGWAASVGSRGSPEPEQEPRREPEPAQELEQAPGGDLSDSAGTRAISESRPAPVDRHKKRSVGSVDQFMKLPDSQTGPSCRRKSECNRMYSMSEQLESSSSSFAANEPAKESAALDDLLLAVRPASACSSLSSSLEKSGHKINQRLASNQSNQQQHQHQHHHHHHQQQQQMLRKSSLNILRSSDDSRPISMEALSTSASVRKSSVNAHGQLKGTKSVCASASISTSELAGLETGKQNISDLERELEALKVRLDKRIGGVKMSKVTQSYLSYFKQWAEYDPFIAQPIPSNPWISDSTELWDSERQTKDVHCRRVRRWAFSLKELLNDPAGREQFHRFLEKEFSAENLKFWDAVQELKRVHSRDVARRVEAIWTEYLAQDANCPINIDSKSYETSKKNMAKNKNNRYIFDEAAGHVYQLMKNDSYPRYLRSDMYKDYKEASEKKRMAFDVFKPQITTLKHKFNF